MVAPKSERMVLEHFVPTFYSRLIHIKSVLFLANLIYSYIAGETMDNNQNDIQDENQLGNQNEKNISCNIFLEQIELINQLPEAERAYVLYMAILKAFSKMLYQDDKQDENHLAHTYISISKSISLSKLSISILNILNKTFNCKIYSKNWGGKREKIKKENTKGFIKPTVEDIKSYCIERKNNINAQQFFNFYESKGWLIGKNKMKDWKAAVRTWEQKDKQSEKKVIRWDY